MKKLMIVAIACIVSSGVFAQQKTDSMKMDHMDHMMKDCVMMKDGKMMVMKGGQTTEMSDDMTLTNGTMVMKDGTVKTKDGKTMMLKDGQSIGLDGKMMKMKKDKMKNEM